MQLTALAGSNRSCQADKIVQEAAMAEMEDYLTILHVLVAVKTDPDIISSRLHALKTRHNRQFWQILQQLTYVDAHQLHQARQQQAQVLVLFWSRQQIDVLASRAKVHSDLLTSGQPFPEEIYAEEANIFLAGEINRAVRASCSW